MKTDYAGIDYGFGQTNINRETGIRFGVISSTDVLQSWADSAESDYGAPHCPKCGNEATDSTELSVPDFDAHDDITVGGGADYYCADCRYAFDACDAFGDEPESWILDDGEYLATQSGDSGDIFVIKSPYYTRAQFCSPCAPGAAYLRNPCADGPRAYCFGADWFDDEYNPCPYPVYRVSDDAIIYIPIDDAE